MTEKVLGPSVSGENVHLSDHDRLALLLADERVRSALQALGLCDRKGQILSLELQMRITATAAARAVIEADVKRVEAELRSYCAALGEAYGTVWDETVTYDAETGLLQKGGEPVAWTPSKGQ